jgi:hypothetical protein
MSLKELWNHLGPVMLFREIRERLERGGGTA